MVHYRRYFGVKKKPIFSGILTYNQIMPLLEKYRVFVPQKRHYYIETLYSHYAHTHYASHLDYARKIIERKKPEYLSSFDKALKKTSGHMFNMVIMDRELLNRYCLWLFDILFEMEKNIEVQELSSFQGRLYGRISEILFNVWLDEQLCNGQLKKTEIKELPYFHLERINWLKKGTAFLRAKICGKKYEKSF